MEQKTTETKSGEKGLRQRTGPSKRYGKGFGSCIHALEGIDRGHANSGKKHQKFRKTT